MANQGRDLFEFFGKIIDTGCRLTERFQEVRVKLQIPDNDARIVGLGGMQHVVAGYTMGAHSLIHGRDVAQVVASIGNPSVSTREAFEMIETAWRLGLCSTVHFKLDSMFQNIVIASGEKPDRSFKASAEKVLRFAGLPPTGDELNTLVAFASLRNSMHNNGIHQNADLDVTLKGTRFEFVRGKAVQCGSFEDTLLMIEANLDVLEMLLMQSKIRALPSPMHDEFSKAVAEGRAVV